MEPEKPGEFDDFLESDEALERELLNSDDDDRDNAEWTPPSPPQFGYCLQVIGQDETGEDVMCNEMCNPASQLCKDCVKGNFRFF